MKLLNSEKVEPDFVEAKHQGQVVRVAIEDVHFFYAEHKYVTLFAHGVEMLITPSLKALSEFYGDRFVFAGRDVLISRERLASEVRGDGGKSFAILHGCQHLVPMTRRYTRKIR